ncbi:MAG: cation-translocating P-type ATPase [Armatimonadota bacterium]|nr:cation-translocating P-type ATPase [Armatimonadota bacterium]MDR7590301.1 cation-translocating P-type ATPase [Armatimonadota bacterium]
MVDVRRPAPDTRTPAGEVPWHGLPPEEVALRLGTDLQQGLSPAEASRRARSPGPNALPEAGGPSPLRVLWAQFQSALVLVLLGAAAVSLLLGNAKEAVAVGAVVALNAGLGFLQEYRAERAMSALRRLVVPRARVRRAGQVREVSSRELVPGDVVLLEAGDRVPADGRLVEAVGLRVDESALTGESVPVDKDAGARLAAGVPLPERCTMVYTGTVVTAGRAVAVVTATGPATELGRIARLVAVTRPETTPLQRRLEHLARILAGAGGAVVLAVAALGFARGEEAGQVWLMAVSLAVAAVPEGLPAVLTVALSLGAQRMLRRRVLIRKLSAVETLGSVTVICTDKTGTLTENRLRLVHLWTPVGTVAPGEPLPQSARLAALVACLCGDAEVNGDGRTTGDPVDAALALAAFGWGFRRREWNAVLPRRAEWPFDSARKRVTTVHGVEHPDKLWEVGGARYLVLVKGAPEAVLPRCTQVWVGAGAEPLGEVWLRQVDEQVEEMARSGFRVLALACGFCPTLPPGEEQAERELVLLGLAALEDPLRPQVPQAVARCRRAGIRVVLVTGDHPTTALAVAQQAGIVDPSGARVATGPELEALSGDQLRRVVREVSVFARVLPEHKVILVEALQAQGEVVAVTGDGVNDGPALRRAEVGVAMGSGTEVAKEASAVVLLDDHFATVVAAVEEGRVVFDNVRKFVRYLFTTNVAELWTVLGALVAGLPFPLYPLQVLWINLVTDGPPALALGVEPPEEDVMRRPPRRRDEPLLAVGHLQQVVAVGLLMGAATLALGAYFLKRGHPGWQTVVFAALGAAQFFNVYAIRTSTPMWRPGPGNPALAASVALGAVLMAAVVYVPGLRPYFRTYPLGAVDLLVCLVPGLVAAVVVEAAELCGRRRREA